MGGRAKLKWLRRFLTLRALARHARGREKSTDLEVGQTADVTQMHHGWSYTETSALHRPARVSAQAALNR
jgi:hypothetical protein